MFPSLISFAGSASFLMLFSDGNHYGLSTDFYFFVILYYISIFVLNFDCLFYFLVYVIQVKS
jgi:hypothetical protein